MSRYFNRLAIIAVSVMLLAGCAATTAIKPDAANSNQERVKLPHQYDQALALMRNGDYQAAIPALKTFIDKQPELAGPWVNLGISYQQTGQRDEALAALQKAVQLNPNNAVCYHQLGIEYREQGQFEPALQAYQRALALDAQYGLAHRNIGILYDLYLQQPATALEHYRKYLELAKQPDQQVSRWVIDLERRTATTQARAGQ